jgi:hypothetical protein
LDLHQDPYLDPYSDSLEMLDPHPQLCFYGFGLPFHVCEMVKEKSVCHGTCVE